MTSSYTTTESTTFTVAHAKHMAAKVSADLKRLQRLYGHPDDARITRYEAELVTLLKYGYLDHVTYGFKRNNAWIEPTLKYTAKDLAGSASNDDDPGRIRPGANIAEASFYSFLEYSSSWYTASSTDREDCTKQLPFSRGDAEAPGVSGYVEHDRTYSAGGRALNRGIVRSA